ncbi:hypothetical protein QUF64_16410 [Anaerolineales bacterium HSG6]|nr:hypothetical protein [Anaerolineales bacterium HSG6]MDM8532231.1 hypothetical protein [Anaerolineales bacterium HSG25]
MAGNNIPKFLKVGQLVKVQHWYGQIEDVAVSDKRIMVLVKSPKGIWRNHPAEWLEFKPQQIKPASAEEAVQSIDIYTERVKQMLADIEQTRQAWGSVMRDE